MVLYQKNKSTNEVLVSEVVAVCRVAHSNVVAVAANLSEDGVSVRDIRLREINTSQSAWTTSFLETHELPVDVSFEPLTEENVGQCLSMMKARSNPNEPSGTETITRKNKRAAPSDCPNGCEWKRNKRLRCEATKTQDLQDHLAVCILGKPQDASEKKVRQFEKELAKAKAQNKALAKKVATEKRIAAKDKKDADEGRPR